MADEDGSSAEGAGGQPAPFAFRRSDLVLTAVIVVLCAILYWDTTRWAEVPASLAQNAPPTVFPRLLLGTIVILALFLPFEPIWKARSGIDVDFGEHERPRPVVFITAIIVLLAGYLLPILGALPVMVATTALLPLLWGEKRYWIVALFALGLPAAVVVLFAFGLQVNLAFGLTGDLFR